MPLIERSAATVQRSCDFIIRIADPPELEAASRLAAAAFSLSEAACQAALPQDAIAEEGNGLWIAERRWRAGRLLHLHPNR